MLESHYSYMTLSRVHKSGDEESYEHVSVGKERFSQYARPELQKASNLPPSKIFKVCKPSSKCCKVRLSKLKIRMNLENESIFFQKESSIIFFVMLEFRIHYIVC